MGPFAGMVPVQAKARGLLSGTVIRGPLTKGVITLVKRKIVQRPFILSYRTAQARSPPRPNSGLGGPLSHLTRGHRPLTRISASFEGSDPLSESPPHSRVPTPRADLRFAQGARTPSTGQPPPLCSTIAFKFPAPWQGAKVKEGTFPPRRAPDTARTPGTPTMRPNPSLCGHT
jgi:hypothetical protein